MATRNKQRLNKTNTSVTNTATSSKRRGLQLRNTNSNTNKKQRVDDVISSSDSDADEYDDNNDDRQLQQHVDSESENEYEDADNARIRIAKQYLQNVKSSIVNEDYRDDEHASDNDNDHNELTNTQIDELKRGITSSDDYLQSQINDKLQSNLTVQQRRHTIPIAETLHHNLSDSSDAIHKFKGHSKPVTCCAVSDKYIVSGSLDGSIQYYDLHTNQRIHTFPRARLSGELGHKSSILTCDITDNSHYIATAGHDHNIHLWDTRANTLIQKITSSHRDIITSLRFSPENNELYSASYDRTVKVYNVAMNADTDDNESVLSYLDTLYGHTSHVTSLCTLQSSHVLSGGYDKSLRMFNKEKQTQLLYKGSQSSIDCISMFNDNTYISGNQDGQIQLWNSNKKNQYKQLIMHIEYQHNETVILRISI